MEKEISAKSTIKVKKSEFGKVAFHQLLQEFEDNKILLGAFSFLPC